MSVGGMAGPEFVTLDDGRTARWRRASDGPAPDRTTPVDDTWTADAALRRMAAGEWLRWTGDYPNARQLLAAVARRLDRNRTRRSARDPGDIPVSERFHRYRAAQGQRARTLGRLVVALDDRYELGLPRAPEVRAACEWAWGPAAGSSTLVGLRDLLGVIGAHQWSVRGVEVPALGAGPEGRVYPAYGVFAPVRSGYVDLVAAAPLPGSARAVDVGTGTGVLAAVLARQGMASVTATDTSPAAVGCARANLDRLGLADRCRVVEAPMFGPARADPGTPGADVVVCNPPWLPGRPASLLDRAVFDPESGMLRAFLAGAADRLADDGEAWLVLSDLAERLELRGPDDVPGWIDDGGLRVIDRVNVPAGHRRAADVDDPFHAQRAAEITSLWRLRRR